MMEEFAGVVKSNVFSSRDGSFSVFRMEEAKSKKIITVAGNVAAPYVGEKVVVKGCWKKHPRFGMQIKAYSLSMKKPSQSEEILQLLGSGMIRGIGPAMAKRIVDEFGDHTLEIMDSHIESLLSIPGIGQRTLDKIKDSYHGMGALQELTMYLQSMGISSRFAVPMQNLYGNKVMEILKEDPYRVISDLPAFGFLNADRIALFEGIPADDPRRILQGFYYVLRRAAGEGNTCLPAAEAARSVSWLLHIDEKTAEEEEERNVGEGRLPVVNYEKEAYVYLPSLYDAESESSVMVHELLALPDLGSARLAITKFEKENRITLDEGQKQAVNASLHSGLLVITGGPGTGKTTLIKAIITAAEEHGLRTALMAPTGRAAKRLAYLSGRDANTIHKALEAEKHDNGTVFMRDESNPLDEELIIIDEASMLDISLFHHVLCALKPGARLIMAGDVDQLPPVGPGFPLRDLIRSKEVPVIQLEHIFRQKEGSSIIENASLIKKGKMCHSDQEGGFLIYPVNSEQEAFQTVMKICRELHYERDEVKLNFQVLSPLYKGLCGVDHLNDSIQAFIYGQTLRKERFYEGDKVMQKVNDYEKEVYNGDIGIVYAVTPSKVLVHYPDREITYEGDERNELQLAFAVTVHKSQGSEYNTVVFVLLPTQYMMLQRNLLYTGITRARRQVILITTEEALQKAIATRRDNTGYSLFLPLLKGEALS